MPSDVAKPANPEPAPGSVTNPENRPPDATGPIADVPADAAAPAPVPEPTPAQHGAPLNDAALDQLFRAARTQYGWTGAAVSDDDLRAIFDLMKWGPTSANCSPARFLFLRTQSAKERLRPALSSGNLQKTMLAPVTVIVAYDPKFYDYLPRLFPHTDAKPWFTSNPELAQETAFRNGTLQGAYFMLAAPCPRLRPRPDVRLRYRQGRRRIPLRPRLEIQLPGQSRPRRPRRREAPRAPLLVR